MAQVPQVVAPHDATTASPDRKAVLALGIERDKQAIRAAIQQIRSRVITPIQGSPMVQEHPLRSFFSVVGAGFAIGFLMPNIVRSTLGAAAFSMLNTVAKQAAQRAIKARLQPAAAVSRI